MAGIRRAPKAPPKPKRVVKAPLHQRILGRAAVEVDTIDDLRLELDKALELDLIEYDTFLDCHEALDLRESKAKEAILKATGRYVKPDKKVDIQARRVRQSRPKALSLWQKKLIFVVCFLIFIKVFC
ncbi:hypothetical protein psageK4_169 [Pseudomonas phage psageK4]|uniref:Uncharacterized protein n=1 Tax=Pseudomonas phage psageK4 TaxID=2859563 RepID=A0ABX8SNP2_9CAUD|nr:hypothetical protein QGX14_gp066 [Pseudomonas phage psageK4]QXV71823.1 hypothetical protein psageK4_169 [Pseudomonas phage psageK4]